MTQNKIPTARSHYETRRTAVNSRLDEYLKKYPPQINERYIKVEVNPELYSVFYGIFPDKLHTRQVETIALHFADYMADKNDGEYLYEIRSCCLRSGSYLTLTSAKRK